MALLVVVLGQAGCSSPEDGRARGGGAGGDGGNYIRKPVPVPSKIEGTRGEEMHVGGPTAP
jgi:hypothetical protein